jgi:hypothetical protein
MKYVLFLALGVAACSAPERRLDTMGEELAGEHHALIVGRTGPAPAPVTSSKPIILPDGGIFDESEDFVWVCPDAGKK